MTTSANTPEKIQSTDTEKIRAILEHLVSHFAEKDENGDWWGFDTNVGNRIPDFTAAINAIKGQNLYHRNAKLKFKYYKELNVDRVAITRDIWGNKVPGWWKGSKGEWDILELISKVKTP